MRNLFLKRTNILTRQALVYLYWEVYAPVFAPALLAISLFAMGSFSGLWQFAGDPWRGLALLITSFISARACWQAVQKKKPHFHDAQRRLEADNALTHRPLDVLHDHPALGHDLWQLHYRNMLTLIARLSPPRLRPALAPQDTFYLRVILPIALLLTMTLGLGDNMERLRHSLVPQWQHGIRISNMKFDAWIMPPDYTLRPPLYLKDSDSFSIPVNSELVVRVSGSRTIPRLKISQKNRQFYLTPKRLGPKSFESRQRIHKNSTASWSTSLHSQGWRLNVIPDHPPKIAWLEPPKINKRDNLILQYSLSDDYGVTELGLDVRWLTDTSPAPTTRIDMPLPGANVKYLENAESDLNLTKHSWAGRKVAGRLMARDGSGQLTYSDVAFFTLPDKIFIEPLAKAIAEQRLLILSSQSLHYAPPPGLSPQTAQNLPLFDAYEPELRLERAPEPVQKTAQYIDIITTDMQELFQDPALYLGMKHTLARLRYARTETDLEGLSEDLWLMALRAEFGILGTALEEMRQAEQNLRRGMARRAPQREIDALFERYNQAVDAYMEALRREALAERNFAQGGNGDARNMAEIEALLKAIEEANRIGDVEGARWALAKLAELLERIKVQLAIGQGTGDGDSPSGGNMSEEMQKALEELADLLGEQRQLKDQTEQAQQNAQNQSSEQGETAPSDKPQPGRPGQNLANQQDQLQQILEMLSGQATGSEEAGGDEQMIQAFKEAEQAMQDSQAGLQANDMESAIAAQTQAIDALRQAGNRLATLSRSDTPEQNPDDTNPLGSRGYNSDDFETDIEHNNNALRSRKLLEELKRRAAEQTRDQQERDYLKRLLKQF